ncbi:MAG: hypothetical protein A2029_11620 [Chloroflexi bacterium RBG_19FT_COMBO_47_9]|nr:MAG: hypothetical protein A2029_11620 [Chloroflexi bacterium RBG_19FT_COMBO_47_9]
MTRFAAYLAYQSGNGLVALFMIAVTPIGLGMQCALTILRIIQFITLGHWQIFATLEQVNLPE